MESREQALSNDDSARSEASEPSTDEKFADYQEDAITEACGYCVCACIFLQFLASTQHKTKEATRRIVENICKVFQYDHIQTRYLALSWFGSFVHFLSMKNDRTSGQRYRMKYAYAEDMRHCIAKAG